MSNCVLVAARSLIDLAASRLALRAPALRAATALTRPTRSARWLPCDRRVAPIGAGPGDVVTQHRVEGRDHLAHHSHDRDLWQFARSPEAIAEGLECRIPVPCAHGGHVEHVADWGTTSPNAALALELSAVKVVGSDADQRRDLFAAHAAEFRQQRDQGAGQNRPNPRHGGEQAVAMLEYGINCDNLAEVVIELGNVVGE